MDSALCYFIYDWHDSHSLKIRGFERSHFWVKEWGEGTALTYSLGNIPAFREGQDRVILNIQKLPLYSFFQKQIMKCFTKDIRI